MCIPGSTARPSVIVTKEQCKAAYDGLSDQERTALTNIHGRVKAFAEMQRKSVVDMEMPIPGGFAGHTVSPCKGELIKNIEKYFLFCLFWAI